MPNDNRITKKNEPNILPPPAAPERPAQAMPGMELLCEHFETGGPVMGTVVGADDKWVRVRLDIGREWLIRPDRIDLAKGTWTHVDGDYPALAADANFDANFRGIAPPKDDAPARDKLRDKVAELAAMLPPEARAAIERIALTVEGKVLPAPSGTVFARWDGRGVFAGAFVESGSRQPRRDAMPGTIGFFSAADVAKWNRRSPGSFVEL